MKPASSTLDWRLCSLFRVAQHEPIPHPNLRHVPALGEVLALLTSERALIEERIAGHQAEWTEDQMPRLGSGGAGKSLANLE
jgi:hypothetical protein